MADAPTIKITESTSNDVASLSSSEVVVPSLHQPQDTAAAISMVDQLVKKHIKEELSKDIISKQPILPSSAVAAANIASCSDGTKIDDKQTEDVGSTNAPKPQPDDNMSSAAGRLSPLFPNLTGEDDSKSSQQGNKSTHSGYISVLLSLTNNWPSIVTTILGKCLPSCGEGPRGIPTSSDNDIRVEYSSQACDHFIQDLLYNCDYTVAESIADTIIAKLNDGFAVDRWTLDDVLQLEDETVVVTEDNVALIVGKKFLHSLVRLLAIELSDPVIGGDEASERTKSVIILIQ